MSAHIRRELRRRHVTLRLAQPEWDQLNSDAAECGMSCDELLSLIISVRCRARILGSVQQAIIEAVEPTDESDPGSARWNDRHRPFGPDTTMA